jgi:hypothetical protein
MSTNDTLQPRFIRLLKADGHLGMLYDPQSNTARLVCRHGTVDYDLNAIAHKESRRKVAHQRINTPLADKIA